MKDYTGVKWDSKIQKWVATIRYNEKKYYCGSYVEQKDAVKERDMMILKHSIPRYLQILKPINGKKKIGTYKKNINEKNNQKM